MDDRTLPRIPVVLATADVVGVRVFPSCIVCGTEVLDLTDAKHHVCVPDAKGAVVLTDGSKWTKTTADVGEQNYRAEQTAADLAAADAVQP